MATAARKKAPAKKPTDKRGSKKGQTTHKGGRGGSIGQVPFIATRDQRIQVEALVAAGTEQWLIADLMGIHVDTLRTHFRTELDTGKARVDAKVGAHATRRALEGDWEAQKYYLARRAGWKQATTVENTGPGGGPMQFEQTTRNDFDFSGLSLEEKLTLEKLLAKAKETAQAAGADGSA